MNQTDQSILDAIRLPHSPEARYLKRLLNKTDDEVEAVASLLDFRSRFNLAGTVDLSEWAIEIFAQAAATLIPQGRAGGVIAKIDWLEVEIPLACASGEVIIRMRRLSDPDAMLVRFHGSAFDAARNESPFASAEFWLHVPHG